MHIMYFKPIERNLWLLKVSSWRFWKSFFESHVMGNEVQSGSQKRISRKATRTLLVDVEGVLYIVKPYYAYEKCSSDVRDSIDTETIDIRRANQILSTEKGFLSIFKT